MTITCTSFRQGIAAGDNKSVLVLGAPRGGTSAVAGLLQHLGVMMCPNELVFTADGYATYEDLHLCHALKLEDWPLVQTIITQRTQTYAIWGVKWWSLINELDRVLPWCNNPHIVNVFRDPVAILSHDPETRRQWKPLCDLISRQQEISMRQDVPQLVISYERCKEYPLLAARELCAFLQLSLDSARQELAAERIGHENPHHRNCGLAGQ